MDIKSHQLYNSHTNRVFTPTRSRNGTLDSDEDEELNVFNNTTKYLISKKYSVKKIDIKWFKLDEILNFTDYFDKSFLRTFLKFLKTSEL